MDKDVMETHLIYIRSNLSQVNRKLDSLGINVVYLREQYEGDRGIKFRLNKLENQGKKRTCLATIAGFLAGLIGYFSIKIGG